MRSEPLYNLIVELVPKMDRGHIWRVGLKSLDMLLEAGASLTWDAVKSVSVWDMRDSRVK